MLDEIPANGRRLKKSMKFSKNYKKRKGKHILQI
jgi:hypothetical protein